ncbi:MAG: hypothetical protein Fur0018_17610 [Anaerolineales bacterium]
MTDSGVVVLLVLSALGLLLARQSVQIVLALTLQYALAGGLVMQMWPPRMALIKIMAGWAAVLILYLSARRVPLGGDLPAGPGRFLARFSAGLLALLAVFSLLPVVQDAVPGITPPVLGAAMWLMLSALMQLGFTLHPLRTAAGWLTLMTGFEIIYAAIERSILIALLLAALQMALALAGAYLLLQGASEEEA